MADKSELKGGAAVIALGIFLSRILGLIRERVFAHYFGNSSAADAFKAALRIPNVLQNLFGEGVLSGSFIPVYAKLLAEGKEDEARSVSTAVLAVLVFIVSLIVALGVTFSPLLVAVIAPGFEGEKRELTITLTRIFFPGIGLLVGSAWCLGVLNSHGKFFLSYTAPVFWNLVIIATLVIFGNDGYSQESLAVIASWGVVLGCGTQLLVQIPSTLRLTKGFARGLSMASEPLRRVFRSFFPILIGRGIVQISAYVDSLLASLLPTGAVAALSYSQTLYLLPIGLFGMSVSAAELPAMSRVLGGAVEANDIIRERLAIGLRRISFFVIPSAVIFIALGDALIAGVYQTGEFTSDDSLLVWRVLAAASIGLLPATLARLYASTFYALSDANTPLKFSLLRVFLSIVFGAGGSIWLPAALGLPPTYGLFFLSGASALTAIVEFMLLRRALGVRLGTVKVDYGFLFTLFGCAALAAVLGRFSLELVSGKLAHAAIGTLVFGLTYLGLCFLLHVPECRKLVASVTSRLS